MKIETQHASLFGISYMEPRPGVNTLVFFPTYSISVGLFPHLLYICSLVSSTLDNPPYAARPLAGSAAVTRHGIRQKLVACGMCLSLGSLSRNPARVYQYFFFPLTPGMTIFFFHESIISRARKHTPCLRRTNFQVGLRQVAPRLRNSTYAIIFHMLAED